MRDWLPESDPVWLVISAVAQLDTAALHGRRRTGGAGRAGYDPEMLLTLLIWAWAQGVRSSRVIERLCGRDVAFRIICAGDGPDHVTISRFRAEAAPVMEQLFAQVLALCARLGMAHLGVVALDSVKIASDASLKANYTAEGLGRLAAEQAGIDIERA
jgi:transposase